MEFNHGGDSAKLEVIAVIYQLVAFQTQAVKSAEQVHLWVFIHQ
jgi:hypothetical protein